MHRRETHHVIGKGNTNSYENYILWIFPNLLITKLGPFITRIIVQPTGLDEGMARVRFSVIDKTICYGDDEIKLPVFARDLPLYWKLKMQAGEEDEVRTASPVKTFVYKQKKRKRGVRKSPGGFR